MVLNKFYYYITQAWDRCYNYSS